MRQGLRGALLGAAAVAALLGTTACQPSGGEDNAGPSASASAGENTSKSPGSSGDSGTAESGSGGSTGETTGDSGETSGGNGTKYQDCKVTDLNTAVELQDAAGETPATSC